VSPALSVGATQTPMSQVRTGDLNFLLLQFSHPYLHAGDPLAHFSARQMDVGVLLVFSVDFVSGIDTGTSYFFSLRLPRPLYEVDPKKRADRGPILSFLLRFAVFMEAFFNFFVFPSPEDNFYWRGARPAHIPLFDVQTQLLKRMERGPNFFPRFLFPLYSGVPPDEGHYLPPFYRLINKVYRDLRLDNGDASPYRSVVRLSLPFSNPITLGPPSLVFLVVVFLFLLDVSVVRAALRIAEASNSTPTPSVSVNLV